MLPLVILLAVPLSAQALSQTHGVSPPLLSKFAPLADGTWSCLNSSKRIPWSAVNDDYCDCPDGSDEPGTGACKDTTFYCRNEGHIGATIPSSRVRDGLCDAACCDGSDERPGVCPDTCKEAGAAFRQKRDAERKLRKTGSKIRASYIVFAQKEKKRLEALVARSALDIQMREKEVADLREIADRTESISAAALEMKKQSPLYQSLTTHSAALKSLRREYEAQQERADELGAILDALRTGYNPNYQDMAVLEAVRGWETLAGLPHINDVRKAQAEEGSDGDAADEGAAPDGTGGKEALEEGAWSKEKLATDLDGLLKSDYEGLLLEHDRHVGSPVDSLLFDVSAYLPEALVPQFEAFRDTVLGWLRTFGVVQGSADTSAASARARQNLADAERDLSDAQSDNENADTELRELFDVEKFGAEGAWKKLEGTCLELDTGEYIYEVCLFGQALQKNKKGGGSNSLGHFSGWNKAAELGTPEYYSAQSYTRGGQCWNGPQRSVRVLLSCGTENTLLTVAEPEKCEYEITGTSPALCLPLDAESSAGLKAPHEEL